MNPNPADPAPAHDQSIDYDSSDFARALSQAQKHSGGGALPPEIAIRLARTRETETAKFCLHLLAETPPNEGDQDLVSQFCHIEGFANRVLDLVLKQDPATAKTAAMALIKLDSSFQLRVAAQLNSDDVCVVSNALDILDVLGDNKLIVPALFSLLSRPSSDIRVKATSLIQKLDRRFVYTRRLLGHADPRVRAVTLQSIMGRSEPEVTQYLSFCASDPDSRIRSLAALGLRRRGDPAGAQVLNDMMSDSDPSARLWALWALGTEADKEMIPTLEALERDDPNEQVRKQAAITLAKIAHQIVSPNP